MEISPEHFIDLAKLEFLSLRDLEKPETGDRYFAKYGVGNTPAPDRAFERFVWYETLLSVLRTADENRYRMLHKGPAFYFLGWTAFHMRSYQKAVFYMDAALSEDIRKTIEAIRVEPQDTRQSCDALVEASYDRWIGNPAGLFATLRTDKLGQSALGISIELRKTVADLLNDHNKFFCEMVTIEEFTGCFVRNLLVCRKTRSIVSALYSWLLESNDLRNELLLRGDARGSIEPFVLHLLKGGLIYESVLRRFYKGSSLTDLYKTREFKRDFDNIVVKSGASNYRHIYKSIAGRSVQSALDVATQLRNLSGHDLARDDIFDEHAIYSRLTEQLADATLIALKLYRARSIGSEADATA